MGDSRVHPEAQSTSSPAPALSLERSSFLQRNSEENELDLIQEKSLSSSEQSSTFPSPEPPPNSHSFGQVSTAPLAVSRIQPKLTVGQPDDEYEQEADQVADQVMRMPDPNLLSPTRQPNVHLQTQTEPGQLPEVTPELETQLAASKGQGQPLTEPVRASIEPRMGFDFNQVRIHTDTNAMAMNQALNAQAFTHGHDVYFGMGKYDPSSETGKQLLVHELTHVVQQTGAIRRQPNSIAQSPTSEQLTVEETPAEPRINQPYTKLESSDQASELEKGQTNTVVAPFNIASVSENRLESTDITAVGDAALTSPIPPNLPETTQAPTIEQQPEFEIEPTEVNPSPSTLAAPAPSPPALPPEPPMIQRQEEEEDSGILGGIRRRINSIVDALRSGWDRVSQLAQSAFEGIRTQFGNVVEELGSFVTSALSGLQTGWSTLSQMATTLTQGITQQLQGAIATVTTAARAMADAVMRLDVNGIRAAWGQLTGLIGGIWQRLQQAGQAVFQRITEVWTGLQTRFNAVLSNLANRARDIFNRLQFVSQGIRQQLASAWDALRNRASQLSGVLGGILDRLRSLVESLLSWGQRIWNGIQQQWASLRDRVGAFLQQIWQRITTAAQGLRQQATNLWQRITGLWTRLQQWVRQQVQRLVSGVRSIWDRFRNFSIGRLIDKIAKYVPFIRAIEKAVEDPDSAMTPIVDAISGKLNAEMPAKSIDIGSQHLQEQAGIPSTKGTALQAGNSQQSNAGVIQRQAQPTTASPVAERRTASLSEIWQGFSSAITLKWHQLDIWKMVKEMLWSLIWPWPGVGRELSELWNEDLKNAVQSLFSIRSISQDSLGALHDLWSNFLHLLDIPLAIWRRINNILLLLSGWITIFLVVLGAIGGTVAGGVIGGILSGLVSLGVATPAGAAAGAGAGGLTGAGAGFAAAMGLGYVFLVSFAAGETATILKTLVDLLTGEQTQEERRRDYSQLADSLIALGITVVLVALSYIAARLASAVLGVIKRILPPRIQAVIERLETRLRGLPDEDPARKLETGAKDGLESSPETVRDGSVRMEEHPSYRTTLDEIRRLGFEVKKTSGDPYVSVREVLNPEGQVIRVEKNVFVRDGMRFLDLEHELGHIRQLTERFGENPLPTERVIEYPDGRTKQAPDQQGVLTTWQNTVTEFHNRLVEFLRLHERGASPELLREHAQGVKEWRNLYVEKGLKGGRSPSRQSWVQEHFPDLPQLTDRYAQAGGPGLESR